MAATLAGDHPGGSAEQWLAPASDVISGTCLPRVHCPLQDRKDPASGMHFQWDPIPLSLSQEDQKTDKIIYTNEVTYNSWRVVCLEQTQFHGLGQGGGSVAVGGGEYLDT